MKKILITGCMGQLGRAIQKEYGSTVEFIKTDMVEEEGVIKLDISKLNDVIKLFKDKKPDVVINCAAYTNVDGCEVNVDMAYKANTIGPRNLAIASNMIDAKLIHISTDYVFSGKVSDHPLTEFDKENPVSMYGKTKLEGEKLVKELSNKHFILRTAWLYGEGKNFVKTMLKLSETHDKLDVVCDQVGTPTSAKALASMVHFLEGTEEYGTYHATCEGSTNWADFSEEIFKLSGKKVEVNHVTSKEYKKMNPASADRPLYSILDNYMLRLTTDKFVMPHWHDALEEYIKTLE